MEYRGGSWGGALPWSRDPHTTAWRCGTVTSVQPLLVNQEPEGIGFTWDEVRSAEVKKSPPPAFHASTYSSAERGRKGGG